MNKREIAKQKTRSKIIEAAEKAFVEEGISQTTTKGIAQSCQIAHGTIFVHFKSKEDLISAVFTKCLRTSIIELNELNEKDLSFMELVETFFDYIKVNESLFALYFRELSGFPSELKKSLHFFELALRNSFYRCLNKELKIQNPDEIPLLLNVLFSQLQYYYSFAELLCGDRSVIEYFGPQIKRSLEKFFL